MIVLGGSHTTSLSSSEPFIDYFRIVYTSLTKFVFSKVGEDNGNIKLFHDVYDNNKMVTSTATNLSAFFVFYIKMKFTFHVKK